MIVTKSKIIYSFLALLVLFFAVLELYNLFYGVPKDKAIAVGYFSAGFYTLTFGFLLRKILRTYLYKITNQRLVFTIVGSIGSIFIETVIWSSQSYLKTTGAAVHPDLLIDLIMTMPFYILLSYFFAKWVMNTSLSWPIAAFAGGIYEMGADGIIGNLVQFNLSGVLLSPLFIPLFIVTYSPVILVPFLLAAKNDSSNISPTKNYKILLKPLLALLILPFSMGAGFILSKLI